MQCIDHKLKHQQKSGTSGVCIYKCFVAIQVGMQGINKTQEKHVQSHYPGDIDIKIHNQLLIIYKNQ